MNAIRLEDITQVDLAKAPLWEFVDSDAADVFLRPCRDKRASDLHGKLVSTRVRFANGFEAFALIGNVDLRDPKATKHMLVLSVPLSGRYVSLARYFDPDYSQNGPEGFANAVGLPVHDVFPITYNFADIAVGDADAVSGTIDSEPPEPPLTREEIMKIALAAGR